MFNTDYDIDVYWKNDLTCHIKVRGSSVSFRNYAIDPVKLPFGVKTIVTQDDLEEFFKDRCFPQERTNSKQILRNLGIDCYEPELICRKTHGMQFDDFMWLQFNDEPQVYWNDIKLRE